MATERAGVMTKDAAVEMRCCWGHCGLLLPDSKLKNSAWLDPKYGGVQVIHPDDRKLIKLNSVCASCKKWLRRHFLRGVDQPHKRCQSTGTCRKCRHNLTQWKGITADGKVTPLRFCAPDEVEPEETKTQARAAAKRNGATTRKKRPRPAADSNHLMAARSAPSKRPRASVKIILHGALKHKVRQAIQKAQCRKAVAAA